MVSNSSAFGSQTVILIFHLFVIFTHPEIVPFAPKYQYFLCQMESHLQIPKKKYTSQSIYNTILGYHTFSSEEPGGKRGTAYLWFYGEALAKGGDFF